MRICIVIFSLVSLIVCQCNYTSPSTGLFYDLSPLTRSGVQADWNGVSRSLAGTFYFNFCDDVREGCPNQGVCEVEAINSYGWGAASSYSFTDYQGTSDGVVLQYSSGSSECSSSGIRATSEIQVICVPVGEGEVGKISADSDCHLTIQFNSKYGCGSSYGTQSKTPSPSAVRASPTRTPSPRPTRVDNNPMYPLLHGVSTNLGFGYNALSLQPTTYGIFGNWTYAENNVWVLNGSYYSFPDQARVTSLGDFNLQSFVYQSINDYMESVSKNLGIAVTAPVDGVKVGIAAGFESTEAEMESSKGILAIGKISIPLYSTQLYPTASLSSKFVEDVEALPDTYDPSDGNAMAQLQTFLKNYGTHVQIGTDFGGQITTQQVVSQTARADYSSTAVQLQVKLGVLTVLNIDSSRIPYLGVNHDIDTSLFGNTHASINGGDPTVNLDDTDWYYDWARSVPDYPSAINWKLSYIGTYMAQVSTQSASVYQQFLIDYTSNFTENSYTAPPGLINIAIGPSKAVPSVNGGKPLTNVTLWGGDSQECFRGTFLASDPDREDEVIIMGADLIGVSWNTLRTFGTLDYNAKLAPPKPVFFNSRTSDGALEWALINNRAWVPGLTSLGVGIDLPTGQLRLPIFEWTFNSGFTFTLNSKVYSYPDQVFFSSDTAIRSFQDVYYASEQSFITENSTDSSGFFLYGSESDQIQRVFQGGQSILGVYTEVRQLYNMTILNTAALTDEFTFAVNQLPLNYSERAYLEFLSFWGTHVVMAGVYGGSARLMTAIDQTYYSAYSKDEISVTLGANFLGYKEGIAWGTSTTSEYFDFSTESFQWLSFKGGDGSVTSTNQYNAWLDSLKSSPAQVHQSFVRISNFVANPTIAANIDQAITQLFSYPVFQLPIDPATSIKSSSTQLPGSVDLITGYSDTCTYYHGGIYEEVLATELQVSYFYWSTRVGYYTPPDLYHSDADAYDINVPTPTKITTLCPPSAGLLILHVDFESFDRCYLASGTCIKDMLYRFIPYAGSSVSYGTVFCSE